MIAATPVIRDRLIIGLLYGCGLRVAELCRLKWEHVDVNGCTVRVDGAAAGGRSVALPLALLGILRRGVQACAPGDYVFPGAGAGTHLGERMVERIVRRAAEDAGTGKPVCCMTLRHAYAVQRLRDGATIRELQETLGHKQVKTTLRYLRCLPPEGGRSPLDGAGAVTVPMPGAEAYMLPDAAELPFSGADDTPTGFRALLSTHFSGRFLTLKRFARRSRSP